MKKLFTSSIKSFFNICSVKFKMVLILAMIFYLPIIFYMSLKHFNTTDVIPQLKAINTEVLKQLGPFTVRVNVGMYIKNFPVFNVSKNSFTIDSIIWFEYNPDEIMLDTIAKFSIDNGKITYKSPPDIKVSKGRIFVKYNVLFDLKTDLTFRKFPFEDHRLPIVLSNDFVTPNEMFYVVDASSFQMSPQITTAGWKVQDLNVDAGFLPLQLDRQDPSKKSVSPKALFIINFMKASIRKILIIFIPLFAMAFLSLLSYEMNIANVVGKFSLSIASLTALLGYRFVIEQLMPQVSYFTTTDAIYLFLLVFCFINFLVQLLLTRSYMVTAAQEKRQEKHAENKKTHGSDFIGTLERISCYIFIIMSLLLVIVTTYIILT